MKKLTSLQILMLMSLALGSFQIGAKESKAKNKKASTMMPTHQEDLQEAAMLELQGAKDEQAKIEVLADLTELQPGVVEQIIKEEDNLKEDLASIKSFVHAKISEIEKLAKQNVVGELDVARLAVQLADAQAILSQAIAEQRMKHKHNYVYEQTIKDALIKAEQGLKSLNSRANKLSTEQAYEAVSKEVKKAHKKATRSKTKKAHESKE